METENLKSKKRHSDPGSWKRNILKKAKVKGTEHVTYSGKLVSERQLVRSVDEYVPESVRELHLYSDACAGQNKNHSVMRYLAALADIGLFDKIVHRFLFEDIHICPVIGILV
ncbi:hypothetical protein ANN_01004 [Periplaneta americana]|uniref:Uncharacterized protein n=1 Tax=Periplaneta americana TaxID=6978 RepID=A0ABQ8TU26_PERAM|nr:hypothetical protein ANN_01004 [Periplaneta americana]